jgi:glycosyltransferase involved in cell wall biosynthesis
MLSYIQLEKEGRFTRAYNTLKQDHNVYIVDVSDEYMITENRTTLKLKCKNHILRNIEFFFRSVIKAKNYDFEIIYCHNYFTAMSGAILSIIYNKPLIYDAYELYYPACKDKFTIRDRIFYTFERWAIKLSKFVICASEERALIMAGHYNLKKMPIVIRNINYDATFYGENFSKKIWSSRIRIVYAGYLAADRFIIEFIGKIEESNLKDKIKFDIYGDGPLFNELDQLFSSGKYAFASLKGSYKIDDLRTILIDYDIGYLAYPNTDFNNIFCSPNKLFDYVANGLVVIAPYNFTLKKIIDRYKIGQCDSDVIHSLEKVIENYCDYSSNLETFIKENSWLDEEKKLKEIFRL